MLDRWHFKAPDLGELGKGTWRLLTDWGKISLNINVRKIAFRTRFTPGFVAGVKAQYCTKGFPYPLSENYVLEEINVTNQTFTEPGDSGSGVITRDGK